MSTDPEAKEWRRRRMEHRTLMWVGIAGFLACIGAAVAGFGNGSVETGMWVSAGMASGAGVVRGWTGLSRLKHGKEG